MFELRVHNPEYELQERNVLVVVAAVSHSLRTRASCVNTLTRDVTATSSVKHVPTVETATSKNYMFRPVVAIIRFYHSTHLRLFYTIRVAACLMRRSQHQNPRWSIVPLYWVCG